MLALASAAAAPPAVAGEEPTVGALPHFETWSGGQAEASSAFGYAGLVYAPFTSVDADGLRLRIGGGYGTYRYTSTVAIGSPPGEIEHAGTVSQAEILLGTQFTLGRTTAKAYAGYVSTWRSVTPTDPKSGAGRAAGAKLILETWTELDDDWFLTFDGQWGSSGPFSTASARLGGRALDWLAIGPEAGWVEDGGYRAARIGAFARIDSSFGEVTLSAGAVHQLNEATGAYAGASLLTRF